MSREQSDDEDSAGETGNNPFVDATADTEVELHLPLKVDMEPDQIREHVSIFPVPADLDAVDRSPGTQRRKWPRHGFSLPPTPEPCGQLLGAWSTSGRIRGLSSYVRNVQPDISGTAQCGPSGTERATTNANQTGWGAD